ncbi:MAG: mechanosensitive ion channel [Chloroflexi bacterium]|nr:mechanosensitive ion channel [Chloroflexota bacterium]
MNIAPEIQTLLARILVIVLLGVITLLLRRVAPNFAQRIIQMIGQFVNVVRRRDSRRDEAIALAITPPLRLLITIIGLQLILIVVEVPATLVRFTGQLINSLLGFVIFWTLYRLVDVVSNYLEANERFSKFDQTVVNFIRQVSKVLVILFMIIVIMSGWGFDLAGVVAGLGIGGLAVALAAQDALANFIGYFVIVTDAPFKVGHYIVINDVEGFVETISFRSTRMRKRDRSLVVIPNQTVVNSMITNWSRLKRRQVRMTLGVTYDTSEEKLRAVIADIHTMLDAHERVTEDRKLVEFIEFGDSSLNILIIYFVKTIIWEEMQIIRADVNFRLMGILTRNGVSVAFPTTTVNFDSTAFDVFQQKYETALLPSDGDREE